MSNHKRSFSFSAKEKFQSQADWAVSFQQSDHWNVRIITVNYYISALDMLKEIFIFFTEQIKKTWCLLWQPEHD